MAVGLGGEQLWLSPTVANNVNPFDDQSGQGNNGTNNGSTVVSDSSSGGSYAYDFDGVADYISVLGGVGTGTTDAFCVAFWWNWAGAQTVYVWDMDTSENDSLSVITRANPNRLRPIVRPNTLGTPQTYLSVGYNTWEHIVYQRVAGSDEIKSYKNGVETGSAYASVDPVTLGNDLTIGGGNATYLDAMMDDIRWFNKALTQAEITHLATSRGVLGPPGGATHYNPFKSHAFINDFQQRLR